jgi:hypothetical protein
MPAIDVCEPQVIRALEKDGWHIVDKPHLIRIANTIIYADMSLEQHSNGDSKEIIVVEVKCFTNPKHDLDNFYVAIGQYQVYRSAVETYQNFVPVYLALPQEAYNRLTQKPLFGTLLRQIDVKLVIINLITERVIEWIH